ncbi:MAG: helix-turn-helix domain-containing protein [Candidatus Acidiferrales bacterium]
MPRKTEPPPADAASHPEFVTRLRALVGEAGGQRSFAKGVASQGTVNLWLHDSEPRRDKLAAIATATGVSLDWLIAGRGPKHFSDVPPGYIAIDFYDLVKSNGYLKTLGGPDRELIFDRRLLALEMNERANLLALYLPIGDDAESILTATDFVIVDRGARDLIPVAPSQVAEEDQFKRSSLDTGILSVVIEKGRVQTPIIRWGKDAKSRSLIIFDGASAEGKRRRFERDEEIAGITILGPIRFRAGMIRPP